MRLRDFIGDLIGALAVFAIPYLFLMAAYVLQ